MSQPSADAAPSPPRFRWPVRILLFVVLFHMLFRSTDILYPWEDWLYELNMKRMPRGLPTREELAKLREEANGDELVAKRWKECGSSLARYWNCVPTDETREKINSNADWVKYGLAWTASRLQFCECIVGIDQEWAMFSPNVGKRRYMTRARLFFEDGTEFTVYSRSEPDDYTSYSRWGEGKTLGVDRFVFSDHGMRYDACPGYCNFIAHLHPKNDNGSPLQAILLYEFKVHFVPPGEDPHAFLTAEMEATRDHRQERTRYAFYHYTPKTKSGRFVEHDQWGPEIYPGKFAPAPELKSE